MIGASDSDRVLADGYSDRSEAAARCLTTLQRPHGMPGREFLQFRRNAFYFIVDGEHLFRSKHGGLPRRMVDPLAGVMLISIVSLLSSPMRARKRMH